MTKKMSLINWPYVAILAALCLVVALIYFGVGDVW